MVAHSPQVCMLSCVSVCSDAHGEGHRSMSGDFLLGSQPFETRVLFSLEAQHLHHHLLKRIHFPLFLSLIPLIDLLGPHGWPSISPPHVLHSRRQSLDSSSGKQPTCFCFWSRSGLPHGLLRLREQPTMHLPLHSWKYRGHVLYILTPS